MNTRRGVCYWPTFADARAVREQFPCSRVVEYEVGYAVQLEVSGAYVGPSDLPRLCSCGEPEDGGDFGWFDADDGKTYCNACGKVQR